MKRSRYQYTWSVLAAVGLLGCQQAGDAGVSEKLDQINQRLDSIEKKITAGAGAAAQRPPRQRPKRPNPNDVYAAPVGDAPFKGAEHAKVTIVEAFEFA